MVCLIGGIITKTISANDGCIVLAEGMEPSAELAGELIRFVRARLPAFKRPRWVEFGSLLPKTATGKIQRYKLR